MSKLFNFVQVWYLVWLRGQILPDAGWSSYAEKVVILAFLVTFGG